MDDSAAIVDAAPAEPSETPDSASAFELFVDAESVRFHGASILHGLDSTLDFELEGERDTMVASRGSRPLRFSVGARGLAH